MIEDLVRQAEDRKVKEKAWKKQHKRDKRKCFWSWPLGHRWISLYKNPELQEALGASKLYTHYCPGCETLRGWIGY